MYVEDEKVRRSGRVDYSDWSLGLSEGRAEHEPPRERLTQTFVATEIVVALIVPDKPLPLIPHGEFFHGARVSGLIPACRLFGVRLKVASLFRSVSVHRTNHFVSRKPADGGPVSHLRRFEPAAGGPDSLACVVDVVFRISLGQGAVVNFEANTWFCFNPFAILPSQKR